MRQTTRNCMDTSLDQCNELQQHETKHQTRQEKELATCCRLDVSGAALNGGTAGVDEVPHPLFSPSSSAALGHPNQSRSQTAHIPPLLSLLRLSSASSASDSHSCPLLPTHPPLDARCSTSPTPIPPTRRYLPPANRAMAAYTLKRARLLSLPPPSLPLSPSLSPSPSHSLLPAPTSALFQRHYYLPLTRERLALHTRLTESQAHPTNSPMSMAPLPSPSKKSISASSASKTNLPNEEHKLAAHGILICTEKALPLRHTEQDGINMLKDFLFFPDHESILAISAQPSLNKVFLPSDAAVVDAWGSLKTAQPNHLYGYRHVSDSKGSPAFSGLQYCGLLLD
jgi:hypothetical protein